ncbi:MAG: recombinase [Burkholderiales bacterium]|nr:recombinase [Burkholderiales bacterium]
MPDTPSTLESLVLRLSDAPPEGDAAALAALVDFLRPERPERSAQAVARIQELVLLLEERPSLRQALRGHLLRLVAARRQVHMYADSGIYPNESFGAGLRRRVGNAILPRAVNEKYLRDVIGAVFWKRGDHVWVRRVPEDTWLALHRAITGEGEYDAEALHAIEREILEALQILSYRIAATGLEPELVRIDPSIEEFESPFLTQNQETMRWIALYRAWLAGGEAPEDDKHIGVLLGQCEEIIERVRRRAQRDGASISLTYHLLRLEQMIERMRTLLLLLERGEAAQADVKRRRAVALVQQVIAAENTRNSLRDYVARNVELLARQITEHGGRAGEHYVTTDRGGYFRMLGSALGAGAVIAVLAMIKILLLELHLPPLVESAAVCLNYGVGFVLVHMLGFTIATKQPAMTAQTIAATIERKEGGQRALGRLEDLAVDVMRSQFVAIVGNMAMAFPAALALGWAWSAASGGPLAGPGKADKLLHDLDPVASLALAHAAIAGVWLFVSGLIAGYFDNLAAYRRIPERLRALRWLRRALGEARTARLADYLYEHLGAIAGNFFFGVLLGVTPFVGFLVGLPLDIRHIAFSTANLAYGLDGTERALPAGAFAVWLAGLYLIGVTNLLVSFGLAINVALRARGARLRDAGLFKRLWMRFFRSPVEFFVPVRRAPDA